MSKQVLGSNAYPIGVFWAMTPSTVCFLLHHGLRDFWSTPASSTQRGMEGRNYCVEVGILVSYSRVESTRLPCSSDLPGIRHFVSPGRADIFRGVCAYFSRRPLKIATHSAPEVRDICESERLSHFRHTGKVQIREYVVACTWHLIEYDRH